MSLAPASTRSSSSCSASCCSSSTEPQGGSFIVIEHNMDFVMRLCPRIICMAEGRDSRRGQAADDPVEPRRAGGLSWQLASSSSIAVVAGYGSLTILNELTLDARAGEITLLIGPNGAGKSTVLKTLFGLLAPRCGEIRFDGQADFRQGPARPAGSGHRLRAAGTQSVSPPQRAAQSRARRHHAFAAARWRDRIEEVFDALPAAARARRQPGLDAVRRRAEAARDRPRPAPAAACHPDRRAVDRPVAEDQPGRLAPAARR